ncbi:hypothetical protein J4H86_22400 [Spiractinospora alimapuensis]|uniref:hypothetical protein n=1 Tax=Spiractinospora alimapuensis TaxID=2820884 RepID=UPI001F1F91F7|nr:hypothetical protein [Spiractinospora alimapuensis]QVQ51516.1 hypothetical protein J4H86_22400 [Spiractinospora alimapuensis]
MARQMSERQQRLVLALVVVGLIAFGVYLYFSTMAEDEAERAEQDAADDAAPTPMQVTPEDDLDFFEWVPYSEADFHDAALTAREFAAAYGTYDATESDAEYVDRLAALATDDFAETLERGSGGGAGRAELEEQETEAEGYAETVELRSFDDESVTFVVDAQSIAEDDEGSRESLGEFAVTVVPDGDDWQVYDFQPADAGDWGEEL